LKYLLKQLDLWSSYNNYSKCWDSLFSKEDLAYPEELEVDELYVEDHSVVLYKGPHRIRHNINTWDIDFYNSKARLILTHQEPRAEHFEYFDGKRKWLYILRDGRDVINSWMHFAVSPVLLKRHPDEYKISDVKELYKLSGYVEKHIKMWSAHVNEYKQFKDKYLLVRYEDLVQDKCNTILKIVKYLAVSDHIDVGQIVEDTSFQSMKKEAPNHVRKGSKNDWKNYFTAEHKDAFKRIAGHILIEFGYEDDYNW
jgi:hypothetical protein